MSIILWKTAGVGVPTAPSLLARPLIEMGGPSGTWIDITNEWRADTPIVLTYGIQGSDPTDRVASSGTLEWQMDNGARVANPLGWTSPVSRTRLPGWRINVPIRFSIGQTVGARQYKFEGKLADAIPAPDGPKGERRTYCTALDWFDDAATMVLPDLPAYQDRTAGQLVNTLINAIPFGMQPTANKSIDTGVELFPWAFDGGSGQVISVRERLNDIARSEPGYIFLKGGSTGTQLVFQTEHNRSINTTSLFDLADADISAIVAPGSRDDLFQTIRVWAYPTEVYPTPTTIYRTSGSRINAGDTITLFGPYRDVELQNDIIGATAQIIPIANTDYTLNSDVNGSGTDLTANLAIAVPTFTGVGVRFPAITNTGGTDGYLTLQVRGQPIYRREVVAERTVSGSYGVKTLDLEMPFQGNVNTATNIAEAYAAIYGQPYAQIEGVRFCANRNQALFDAARSREPGDKITVTESVTGITSAPFTINSCRYELYAPGILWVTWGLEQASAASDLWQLGVSQLGLNTRLGY